MARAKPKHVMMPQHRDESVSVRKIANGYIVRHCSYGKNGEYAEVETYTDKRPDLRRVGKS